MKKLISKALFLMAISSSVLASEIQTIDGDEAYQLYLKLPGVACQEYRLATYVVLTKYQTKSCSDQQEDASKWNCTAQFALKNGKTTQVISANCSREI